MNAHTLRWFGRVLIGELHLELEQPSLPDGFVLARDCAVPALEVKGALCGLHRPGDEAEGVVFAPLLAVILSAMVGLSYCHDGIYLPLFL